MDRIYLADHWYFSNKIFKHLVFGIKSGIVWKMEYNRYYLYINAFNLLMYATFTGMSSRVVLVT